MKMYSRGWVTIVEGDDGTKSYVGLEGFEGDALEALWTAAELVAQAELKREGKWEGDENTIDPSFQPIVEERRGAVMKRICPDWLLKVVEDAHREAAAAADPE